MTQRESKHVALKTLYVIKAYVCDTQYCKRTDKHIGMTNFKGTELFPWM